MDKVVNNSIKHTIDSNKFTNLKESIKAKKTMINDLTKMIKNIKHEIKLDKNELYGICNHEYRRVCTTTGCYAEYDYICKHCHKFK